jgi:hypothetical protein
LFSEAKQSNKPAIAASKVNNRTSSHTSKLEKNKGPYVSKYEEYSNKEGKQQYSVENDPLERYI